MADLNWKERIASAQTNVDTISASARERMAGLAQDGRAIASSSAEIGGRAVASGRKAMDKALVQSRDLIAERPVTAVVVGLAAGVVLGYLANRLTKARSSEAQADDEFIGG